MTTYEYMIVDEHSKASLEAAIAVALAAGWELVGAVSHIHMPVWNGEDGLSDPVTNHHTHWTQGLRRRLSPVPAVVTSVPLTTASTLLSAANPRRIKVVITNTAAPDVFIKCGAGASPSSYTYRLNGDPVVVEDYEGDVYGARNSGSGTVLVTEFFQ
jgi:hypothetical protein